MKNQKSVPRDEVHFFFCPALIMGGILPVTTLLSIITIPILAQIIC